MDLTDYSTSQYDSVLPNSSLDTSTIDAATGSPAVPDASASVLPVEQNQNQSGSIWDNIKSGFGTIVSSAKTDINGTISNKASNLPNDFSNWLSKLYNPNGVTSTITNKPPLVGSSTALKIVAGVVAAIIGYFIFFKKR